jgi:hypothetical protein
VFRFFGARLFRQTDLDDLRLTHRRKRTFGHAGARKWMGPLAEAASFTTLWQALQDNLAVIARRASTLAA